MRPISCQIRKKQFRPSSLERLPDRAFSRSALLPQRWEAPYTERKREKTIALRSSILRGEILRYQGKADESLRCLEDAWHRARQIPHVLVQDDIDNLICEPGDALRDAGQEHGAESLIRRRLEEGE